ncbi:eIF2A-related protein [Nostoc sp. FACHB-110]|uniref:nSTAND1 domain-containing NTPase n=1 Tax=Nostoc sp. FACHB-110 TaxID=2692834 RepID=UPI001683B83C|nr:caspase family protein [Nostoc sp. FACHB-110]MBD2440460.1 caspase family protein [Nostoc sp. FACHB-110]
MTESNALPVTSSWFDTTHVVAIGIDDYKNGVRSLGKAVNDAVKVAGIIENLKPTENVKYYFSLALRSNFSNEVEQEVTRLDGNRQTYLPTREGFGELLSHLKGTVKKKDRIILYFAGHGIALPFSQVTKNDRNTTSSPSQIKLDDKPQGYLLFQDAVKGDRNTYMKMDELIRSLHDIQCRHGLIILDCCFAGAIEWSLYRGITRQIGDDLVTPSILDRYITKNAWQILTSSSENQVTNEVLNRESDQLENDHRGSGANSPFVIALRKAIINGEADLTQPKRGFIHTTRLIDYLREEIESKSNESNKLQTPCIFPFPLKHEQTAEFVFLLGGKTLTEIQSSLPKDPEIDEKYNPYLGLLSYSTDHSNIFFGRKRLISRLFECVKQKKFPLTVVLGASGSGKSSLVKAGLIPIMFPKPENSQDIHKGWVEFRPGRSPGDSLEQAQKDIQIDSIPQGEKRLLVIDQFEEVETQCQDKEQKNKFWKKLIKLITENAENIDVILTLRSDLETTLRSQFESAFRDNYQFQMPTYNYWLNARFTVPTMEREELEEAIEKPASTRVVFFEEEKDNGERTLVKQLSHEVAGMPGALPLLSVALQSMYKNFAKRYLESVRNGEPVKREITWDDYKSLGGGVVGSLTKRANQLYEELVQDDAYRHTVRNIMLRMISLQGNGLTRRQVPTSELKYRDQKENERVETVIKQFSEARLIVEGSNPPDEAYVEPAHDALVQGWDKFQEWIKQNVKDLILQQSLNAQVSDWKNNEKPETRLWHDDDRLPRLKKVLEDKAKNWLNEQETEFVEQSIKQKRKQKDELTQNRINELTPSANSRFKDNEQLEALTHILKAGKLVQKLIREDSPHLRKETRLNTQLVLRQVLSKVEEKNRFMLESGGHAVDFSRDGQIIATADVNRIVKLFDPEGKQINPRQMNGDILMRIFDHPQGEMVTLRGGSKYLYLLTPDGILRFLKLYLSPDGGIFAQPGQLREGKITLYSRNGTKLKTLTGLDGDTIMTVAFSPDSQVIAYGGWKGWLSLWNCDGERIAEQGTGGGSLNATDFSPNGEIIATGSNDGKVRLWKPDGTHLHEFKAHSDTIWGLCFSPNGKMLATGSNDRKVKLWKLDGTEVKTLEGHTGIVYAVAFDPNDNQNLASASDDGSVKIWNLGGTGLKIFDQHEDSVYTVRFSPDGKTILTTSGHGKVSFWRTDGTLFKQESWHNGPISTLDFSPNGEMIVTASEDKEVRLYNSDGDLIKYIKQIKEGDKSEWDRIEVLGVSFSPNNQMIALADSQGSVKLYNLGDGTFKNLRDGSGDHSPTWAVKFSTDGNILASAHSEGVVRLWRLDGTFVNTLPGGIYGRYPNDVWGIDFSPKGDLIASADIDGTVKLWRLDGSSDQPRILSEASSNVACNRVRFSPNGDLIASAHADGTVKLWNLNGSSPKILEGHKSRVNAVDFSPNGKTLASASKDGRVILWDLDGYLDLDGLLNCGCKWAEAYLTNNPNITKEDRQIILNINKNP